MNKKIIILTLISLLCTFNAISQNYFGGIGVKTGLNISDLTSEKSDSKLISFNAGIFAELNVSQYVSIQPEILFSRQGAQYEGINKTIEKHFDYVTFPLLIKLKVKNFSLEAGGQIGILTSAKVENLDVKKLTKPLDKGLLLGLGYRFSHIYIQARYYWGLDNISKDNISKIKVSQTELKNRVFQISIGYYIF